ncbi:MAG: nucleotidyltransferase family protein [candidate division KSB1 bacterium]|nr:nucleotidyltransferase family protein [candidate division KSB1 bacterium]
MPILENTTIVRPTVERPKLSFREVLDLAEDFFMKKGVVYETMRRLAKRLEEENIPYAIIGGMALAFHGYARLTLDVDVLLTPEGLTAFRERLVGRGYVPAFPGATKSFLDTESKTRIEIITAGEFPGDGLPKPVAFPDPTGKTVERDHVRFIKLETLIELKLASGLTAPHRLRDLSDVQDLIMALDLPLELMEELDESVRTEYRRLWEAAQKGKEQP